MNATRCTRAPVVLSCAVMMAAATACTQRAALVEFDERGPYEFPPAERRFIEEIATDAYSDAARLLPSLPPDVVVRVSAGSNVVERTGAAASVVGRRMVHWTVDPNRPGGVTATARAHLRPTLFHEFHHLARGIGTGRMPTRTLMDAVVHEGLATAFERDFAGVTYPWAEYPPDVDVWLGELMDQPAGASRDEWMIRHRDGRRWIGYRAGAYMVDRAIAASGFSAAELVSVPPADIVRLALR